MIMYMYNNLYASDQNEKKLGILICFRIYIKNKKQRDRERNGGRDFIFYNYNFDERKNDSNSLNGPIHFLVIINKY